MKNSEAYIKLVTQINAIGIDKKDGYDPRTLEKVYEWEMEEVEDIIWNVFFNKGDIGVAQFLPKLKKYDGINALKESPILNKIPSEGSVEFSRVLYEATDDEKYLDNIMKNVEADPDNISFVSRLSYCHPCSKLQSLLIYIYINNDNKVNRSTAVMGLLHGKGIIRDIFSIQEANRTIELRKQFKTADKEERRKIIEAFLAE